MKIISSLYSTFIEFIIVLHAFLVISFAWFKGYIIWRILFNKLWDVLSVCSCTSAIGNLWSICLRVNIMFSYSQRLATQAEFEKSSFFFVVYES